MIQMFTSNRQFRNITRCFVILVYVSFFTVQLNIHFGSIPAVSFFTGDFVSLRSNIPFHQSVSKDNRRESKPQGFRLNKRFHPSYLFIAPEILQHLAKNRFSIQITRLNETRQLASFLLTTQALRGPPQIV